MRLCRCPVVEACGVLRCPVVDIAVQVNRVLRCPVVDIVVQMNRECRCSVVDIAVQMNRERHCPVVGRYIHCSAVGMIEPSRGRHCPVHRVPVCKGNSLRQMRRVPAYYCHRLYRTAVRWQ